MTRPETVSRTPPRLRDLHAIVARVFALDADTVHADLGPEDVEAWDSLGQLELIVAIEKHYGLSFEIEEVFEIFILADIERILAGKGIGA